MDVLFLQKASESGDVFKLSQEQDSDNKLVKFSFGTPILLALHGLGRNLPTKIFESQEFSIPCNVVIL